MSWSGAAEEWRRPGGLTEQGMPLPGWDTQRRTGVIAGLRAQNDSTGRSISDPSSASASARRSSCHAITVSAIDSSIFFTVLLMGMFVILRAEGDPALLQAAADQGLARLASVTLR